MNVWGFEVRSPTLDRRLAALLLARGLSGHRDRLVFERTIRPGDAVVDVGANQGIFTLLFSRLAGGGGSVLALEPEPRLFAALEENCRRNGASNVHALRMAAGERRSEGVLRRSPFNRGDNRMTDSVLLGGTVPVEIAPLDELVHGRRVDFVKIDVQGYEMQVLRGMGATLAANEGIRVYFEYWPEGLGYAGTSAIEPLRFLTDRGFRLFEESRSGPRPVEAEAVARGARSGHLRYRNLLATRSVRADGSVGGGDDPSERAAARLPTGPSRGR